MDNNRVFIATLENFDGLPQNVVKRMQERRYFEGQLFDVKSIDSDKVVIKSQMWGETEEFEVSKANVVLIEKIGDDYYIVFDDENQSENDNNHKEKGNE